ncbi:MAG: hypothetical protein AABZ74_14880 [Cyanobacteriota bacterium]
MKKSLLITFLLLNIILLTSCILGINNTGSYGSLLTSVKFPDQKFSLKFIPDNTNSINIKIEGVGINTPIQFNLTRNERRVLKDVPTGEKNIKASAVDINGNIVAQGKNNINIIADKINTVEITLEANNVNLPTKPIESSETQKPVETKSDCIIKRLSTDPPLSKTIEQSLKNSGCEIILLPPEELPSIPKVVTSPENPPSSLSNPNCLIKIKQSDLPLSKTIEEAIKDAGCKIILPEPISNPPITNNSGGGGASGRTENNPNLIPVNVTIHTPTPIPSGVIIN